MSRIEPRLFNLRDGAALTVRTAEEPDVAALLEHGRRMAVTSEHIVAEPDELRDETAERQWVRDMAAAPNNLALVARAESASGELAGELSFRGHPRRRMAHHGQFGIGVAEAWRGRGVGRALIAALLEWGAAHPTLEKISLGVFETNSRARRLYERLGFVEEARQRCFFKIAPGTYADDVLMAIYVKPGVAPPGFNTYTPGSLP